MARNADSGLLTAFASGLLVPAIFAQLGFRSSTQYAWSGVGPIVVDAQTYLGVGSVTGVGAVIEGTDVTAAGTTLTMSGIDPTVLDECLTDIKSGGEAKLWVGAFSGLTLIARYLWFDGVIDKAMSTQSDTTATISLALESRLLDLGRATQRRYTAADQNNVFPTDTAFNWVEVLNDATFNWGS